MMAVSSLVSVLPQFLGSRYHIQPETDTNPTFMFALRDDKLYRQDAFGFPQLSDEFNDTQFMDIFWSEDDKENWFKTKLNPFNYLQNKVTLCYESGVTNATAFNQQKLTVEPVLNDQPYFAKQVTFEASSQQSNDTIESDTDDSWDDSHMYFYIAVGSVLKGMGHSPLHPLGMSYIDDHATVRNSAVYIGIIFICT